jgi:hypothetical protein
LLGSICFYIPEDHQLCGENLYAHHSIFYEELPSYFFLFGVFKDDVSLSWDEVEEIGKKVFVCRAPVLYRGVWDEDRIKSIWTGKGTYPTFERRDGKPVDAEGYVVRVADEFRLENFSTSVAKYVRKNHVQTDEHWMAKEVIPNRLRR